jgi:hypothetical protein
MLDKINFLHSIVDRTSLWLNVAAISAFPAKLSGSLKNSISMNIPEGYEDDGGFHFGTDPEVEKHS